MNAAQDTTWQHPWLHISLLLRAMLNEPWDGEAWREIPKALAELARIAAAGWFN